MKQPIKMTPGDDTHLSLLMAPHSLNLAAGQLREQLLGYGRAAFVAGHAQLRASTPEAAEDLIEEIIERISDHAIKVLSLREARKHGDPEQIESSRQAVFQADDWIKRDLRILAMRPSSNPGASHCLYQIQEPATKTEALAHYSQQAILAMDEAAAPAAAVPVVLPEPDAAIKKVMGLIADLESEAADVGYGHGSQRLVNEKRAAIESKLSALLAGVSAPAAQAVDMPDFDLRTSEGGRGFVAWYFANVLRRYDYEKYITTRLAADFACDLAKALRALPKAAAPQAQADARDAGGEWQEINTMPTCDDLIWLYCQETNTIDGPIAPDPSLEQFGWTHWAYANAPSTERIDRAAIAAAKGE